MNAAVASQLRIQSALRTATERMRNERGAAMVEYGLLLTMVAIAAIGILLFFGGEIVELFTGSEAQLDGRPGPAPAD